MKQRLKPLLSTLLVLTMLLSLLPGGVMAASENAQMASAVMGTEGGANATPEGDPAGTPDGEPAGTPDGEPAGTPEGEPAGTPDGESAGTPDGEPAGTPEGEPAGTPEGDPVGTPGAVPGAVPNLVPNANLATALAAVSSIHQGYVVMIYYPTKNMVMGVESKPYNSKDQLAAVAAADDSSVPAEAAQFRVYLDEENNYVFQSVADGTFLYLDGTHVRLTAERGEYTSYQLEDSGTGGFFIKSVNAQFAGKAQYLEYYGGSFTCYGMNNDKTEIYTFQFYKTDTFDPAQYPLPELPEPPQVTLPIQAGDTVVLYNVGAQGVLAGQDDNTTSPSVNNAAAAVADGKATPANGGRVFTVEESGDGYFRFKTAHDGYLCSNGTGSNAYYDQNASTAADWTVTAYNGGYNLMSREAKYKNNPQYLEYYGGSYKTYSLYSDSDADIYTFQFYPLTDGITASDGVINLPAVTFGTLPNGYVGQDYSFTFTVEAIFGVSGLSVSCGGLTLQPANEGGTYSVTIPAAAMTAGKLTVAVTGTDTKGVGFSGSAELTVLDQPVITEVFPAPSAQTGEDMRPEIGFLFANGGENPTVTMTVNGTSVTPTGENGRVSYRSAEDLPQGKTTVTVILTRADSVNVSRTWVFTVGTAQYQLYFGQLHSHTGEFSDGAGTLADGLSYVAGLPESENVDFVAFTDHSNYFDTQNDPNPEAALYDVSQMSAESKAKWDTYTSTINAFNAQHAGQIVALAGFEMTWSGGPGHINTFNTPGIVSRNNATLNEKDNDAGLQAYYQLLSNENLTNSISQLNHPGDTFGNFADFGYYDPIIDSRVYLVEVGNGEGAIGEGGYYPSYEQYIMALDKGWHVAPTNNQDNHKGKWGNANDARDVVLAETFTEEAIYDAIRNYRVYSTEDKNLEIGYMVNDLPMGTIIETVPDKLSFEVTVMDPDDTDSIAKVELIVNSGKVAYTWDDPDELATGILSAELTPDYSYYYVRVTQADGDLVVTAPVWVGDSLMLGISGVSASTSTPVTGEAVSINTQLYNSEDSDALVKSVTYTTNGSQVLWVDTTTRTLTAGGTLDLTWDYTPDAAKLSTITVTVVMELESKEYKFSSSVELDVQDAASLTYIGVDASHNNEYVSGYNKDLMNNFTTLANQSAIRVELLTSSEALIAACGDTEKYTAIVLNTPSRRLSEAKDYSEEELAALTAFHNSGGALIITGSGDSNDKAEPHVAATQNRVLEALGSSLRLADDGTYEDASFSLSLNAYGENALTAGLTDADLFSYYGGSSVYAVDGDGAVSTVLPDTVSPVLYANSITISKDADSDGLGGDTVKYPYAEGDERLLVMAMEQQEGKGMILVSGSAFMNDYDLKIPAENANNTFCENLFEVLNPAEITPISEVKSQSELGYKYTIQGVVTSNASGYDKETAFFDCIYVQDETGGINIFPVDGSYKLGDVVRISGTTSAYQGEIQLSVSSIEKVGEAEPVAPTVITAAQLNSRSVEGMLVTVKGSVVNITMANGLVESIYVQDSSGEVARVFIDGYITAEKAIENLATGCSIEATGLASYDDTYAIAYDSYARIRVRDRDEIVCTSGGGSVPVGCYHRQTEIRNAKAATCTEDGYTGDTYCKSCGARIAKGTVIPATGHSYVNGVCTVCGDTQVTAFTDLDPNAWYYEHVAYVLEADLMKGVGGNSFAPDLTMTRAQLATILYRYLDVDESKLEGLENPFTDLKDEWYTDAAIYLASIGVINGTSAITFSPDAVITREEMMTMLYRMSDTKTESDGSSHLDAFADSGEISSFAVDAMDWAVENGLINGLGDGTLAPQGLSTRAQAAKVIHCFILLENAE